MAHGKAIQAVLWGLVLAGLLGGRAAAAPVELVERVGYAYAAGSEELLYREIHRARWRDGKPLTENVVYRDGAGAVIAVKAIDYRRSLQAPGFRMEMAELGYREGLEATEDGLRAFVRPVGERRERGGMVPDGEDLVADAGFDRLIEQRLGDLKAGERLRFRFLVPSRLAAYAFRAEMVKRTRVLGQPAIHVRMEPANVLLRWLADPVDVFYHRSEGRLLRYQGPSNLRRPDGDNPQVRVDFPSGEGASARR